MATRRYAKCVGLCLTDTDTHTHTPVIAKDVISVYRTEPELHEMIIFAIQPIWHQ